MYVEQYIARRATATTAPPEVTGWRRTVADVSLACILVAIVWGVGYLLLWLSQ